MEKLNEILGSIKERISNPLIFSFICSWLVLNWPITFAIFGNTKELEAEGYKSISKFISSEKISYGWPLAIASIYAIAFPFLKHGIKVINTTASNLGETISLRINKEGKVSVEKYMMLKDQYRKRTELLEKTIADESEFQTKYEESTTKLLNAQNTINILQANLNDRNELIAYFRDSRMLNGYWTNTYKDRYQKDHTEEVFIEDDTYYILGKFDERKAAFKVIHFYFHKESARMFFIKDDTNMKAPYVGDNKGNVRLKFNINVLKVQDSNTLIGTENGNTPITYTRKK